MSNLARDNRNRDLAKIHIAKKEHFRNDEDYRAMLLAVGGKESSRDLDVDGRKRVLDHLQACGYLVATSSRARRTSRPTPAPDKIKQVKRIRAQLISLGRKPDAYADGIAKQMGFTAQYYEWCTPEQLHKLSAALGVQQSRVGAATA